MKSWIYLCFSFAMPAMACCVELRTGVGGEMRLPKGWPLIVEANLADNISMDRDWFAESDAGERVSIVSRKLETNPPYRVFDLSPLQTETSYHLKHGVLSLCGIYQCDGNALTVIVVHAPPSGGKISWKLDSLYMNPQRASTQPGLPFIIASASASSSLHLEMKAGARETLTGIGRLDQILGSGLRVSRTFRFNLVTSEAGTTRFSLDNSTCGMKIPIEYGNRYELYLYDGRTVDLAPMGGWGFYVPKLEPLNAGSATVFAEHDRLARGASPESRQQAFLLTQSDTYRNAIEQFEAWSIACSRLSAEQIEWRSISTVLMPRLATAPQGLKI